MVACPSGASVAPGHDPAALIVVSRALWEQFTGTGSSWLDPLLDTFKPTAITVGDLCTLNVDDPADLSLYTIGTALSGNPFSILDVEVWAKAKLSYLAFQANCVCNPGGTPTCSSYFADSTAWPNTDTNPTLTTQAIRFAVLANSYMNTIQIWVYGPYPRTVKCSIWDEATHVRVWTETFTVTSFADVRHAVTAPPLLLLGHNYRVCKLEPAGGSFPAIYTGFSGVTDSRASMSYGSNNGGGDVEPTNVQSGVAYTVAPILCDTSSGAAPPPTPTTPVQPPELVLPPAWVCGGTADICTRLSQISDRLDWLRRDVTLIQRQAVPFAYVNGPTSAGLTGHGTISVSAILGVSVLLTTRPSSWGKTADTPARLIPAVGQLTFSTPDGDSNATLLHYDDELILGVSGAVTAIKYSFRPGIVATVKQLVREP